MSHAVEQLGRAAIVILLLVACSPIAAAAQAITGQSKPAVKRWSISIGAAGRIGSPAGQFEAAMRSARLGETSPADWFIAPQAHPFSRDQYATHDYAVTYRRNDQLALGVVMSQILMGDTVGYQYPGLHLTLRTHVNVLAPVVYLRLGERARVGAGPLVAWSEVSTKFSRAPTTDKSRTHGAIVDAAFEFRPGRRVFLTLGGSYRWIARASVGPFTTATSQASATLPAMRVNLSHMTIGASLGIRF